MNELQKIIKKYPNKPWDWCLVSSNSNITMQFINKYPNNPWNWKQVSRNHKLL
jgi:hypothetical protein